MQFKKLQNGLVSYILYLKKIIPKKIYVFNKITFLMCVTYITNVACIIMKNFLLPAELLCNIYRLNQYIAIFGLRAAGWTQWTGQVVRQEWTPVYIYISTTIQFVLQSNNHLKYQCVNADQVFQQMNGSYIISPVSLYQTLQCFKTRSSSLEANPQPYLNCHCLNSSRGSIT